MPIATRDQFHSYCKRGMPLDNGVRAKRSFWLRGVCLVRAVRFHDALQKFLTRSNLICGQHLLGSFDVHQAVAAVDCGQHTRGGMVPAQFRHLLGSSAVRGQIHTA